MAIAIAAVGAMQFSWFSRSAAAEIESASRSLGASLMQAVAGEYQRFTPILGEIRSFARGAPAGEAEVRAFLERIDASYGGSTGSAGLVSSVAYRADGERPRALTASGEWAAMADGAGGASGAGGWEKDAPPARFEEPPASGSERDFLLRFRSSADGQVLYATVAPSLEISIALDEEGFFSDYIVPAVESVIPDAEISWMAAEEVIRGGRSEDDGARRDDGFNPLRALLGGAAARSRSFSFQVPSSLDLFFAFDHEQPDEDKTQASRSRSAPPYRAFIGGGADRPIPGGGRIAEVTMPASSAVGSIELRLALNWLFGTILLVGVGLAFALAVLQQRKIAVMRQREREFVASVTHELRTPVTAIGSAAENLLRGVVPEARVPAYARMIRDQSARLGSMIEEVLQFSQVEAKSPSAPLLREVDPRELMDDIRAPLETLAKDRGISLEWDTASLPTALPCDPEGLRLIVTNLVANAIWHAYSAGEPGPIRVLARFSVPGKLRVSVEDEGRGIARSEARLVFEPFYRDGVSRERHEKGSGLGLFIARRKARLLGGDLRLESPYRRIDESRSKGCRFELNLPAHAGAKPGPKGRSDAR
ncbi:MAG: HAMP domain-containing sensor histidine kinase [Spirochaetaceae bacterium]|nr:HAMP domain-containing sensor histidine kinase [Spirochaetaceae bacterium]